VLNVLDLGFIFGIVVSLLTSSYVTKLLSTDNGCYFNGTLNYLNLVKCGSYKTYKKTLEDNKSEYNQCISYQNVTNNNTSSTTGLINDNKGNELPKNSFRSYSTLNTKFKGFTQVRTMHTGAGSSSGPSGASSSTGSGPVFAGKEFECKEYVPGLLSSFKAGVKTGELSSFIKGLRGAEVPSRDSGPQGRIRGSVVKLHECIEKKTGQVQTELNITLNVEGNPDTFIRQVYELANNRESVKDVSDKGLVINTTQNVPSVPTMPGITNVPGAPVVANSPKSPSNMFNDVRGRSVAEPASLDQNGLVFYLSDLLGFSVNTSFYLCQTLVLCFANVLVLVHVTLPAPPAR
jgi:hypothetical protein